MNHKGGVGKTTLARLISEYFARKGRNVLGLDTDPQCNYSTRYLSMHRSSDTQSITPPNHPDFNPDNPLWDTFPTPPPGYWSTAQLYALGYAAPYPTRIKNLSIIPAHTTDLTTLLQSISQARIESDITPYLSDILGADEYADYDLIVIDTPPGSSSLNASILHAATHLIIPSELHENSLAGLATMINAWKAEADIRPASRPLTLAGIIPTLYNPHSSTEKYLLGTLEESDLIAPYLLHSMRRLITYQTASIAYTDGKKSLFDMHKNNPCRKEAANLIDSLESRIDESRPHYA